MFTRHATSLIIRNGYFTASKPIFRQLSITPVNKDIVKIQSPEDFKAKVINSKIPVIVDFFAT